MAFPFFTYQDGNDLKEWKQQHSFFGPWFLCSCLSSIISCYYDSTISHCDPLISLISFTADQQHQKSFVGLWLPCTRQTDTSKNWEVDSGGWLGCVEHPNSSPFQELNESTNTNALCVTVFADDCLQICTEVFNVLMF
jgi:hypothetical protein